MKDNNSFQSTDGVGYITHFATCPVAHKFRRKSR